MTYPNYYYDHRTHTGMEKAKGTNSIGSKLIGI